MRVAHISVALVILKWGVLALLPLMLVFGAASDTFTLNPVQRVAMPHRYSITGWEVRNFPDKWLHLLTTLLPVGEKSDSEKRDDLHKYFDLGRELLIADDALNRAMADPVAGGVAPLQDDVERLTAERLALRDGVEETIESALSTAIRESGLTPWERLVFPPVDIRLAGPPVLLLTSPRDRIERQHEVLMDPDISLVVRERLEDSLMADHDVAAISFQVGGLAAYPASVLDSLPMEYTFRASAHEWMHHYMAFRPLGQKMFTSPAMVTLNETLADIVGREIGDRAGELLSDGVDPPSPQAAPQPAPESGLHGRDEHFGFNEEMRETRLRVDELLAKGRVDEAEAYMEERRLFFVENGYPIRRLNQAYFAFHGTYAENAASSSPIAGQLHRFRDLSPDLRTFVLRMADISSYPQFLERLEVLERETASVVP
ncbi:MAG: hypothetical protein OXD46_07375 [Chloroflexi bacterium]|nr:hypothetical protein [Chloroflexota bacterium]